jgi:phage terminase large subunit GpA-like protein
MAVNLNRCEPRVLARAREVFKPEPDEQVWEWAERKVMIPALESDISGPFRASLTPFIKEPLECYRDKTVKQCTFRVATQTFKTLCNMVGVLWYCDHEVGRIIWPWDNETNARRFSKKRWQKLIESSPELDHLIPANRNDFNNLEQDLGGCLLRFMGSHSAGNIASEPADLVVAEEVDKMAEQGERETDAISNVKSRGKSRSNRRQFYASSPTTEWGLINQGFLEGDQRFYNVPCPHCGKLILLEWENVHWDQSAKSAASGEWDMDRVMKTAVYNCQLCGGEINSQQKVGMLQEGIWIPTNPYALAGVRSYTLSSLYSPWESCNWGNLAVYYLNAKRTFNLKDWDNNYLGIPSADAGESADVESMQLRREEYASRVPDEAAFVIITVDTQDDRLEGECMAWGANMENWGVEFKIISGDPARSHVWRELENWMFQDWGVPLIIAGIDIGGHHATEVATFCKKHRRRNVFAVQGSRTKWSPIVTRIGRTRDVRPRIPIINIGTDSAKMQWLSMFGQEEGQEGFCHFGPEAAGYDDEWFRQLGSERCKHNFKRGELIKEWIKTRQRNEALDIRVYNLGLYYRLPLAQKDHYIRERKRTIAAKASGGHKPRPAAPRRPSGGYATNWK